MNMFSEIMSLDMQHACIRLAIFHGPRRTMTIMIAAITETNIVPEGD